MKYEIKIEFLLLLEEVPGRNLSEFEYSSKKCRFFYIVFDVLYEEGITLLAS